MGKYLSFVNECIQNFKPIIEEKTGIKLEDVIAREASEYPDFDTDDHSNVPMFVDNDYPGTIFVNEEIYGKIEDHFSKMTLHTTHELSHLAHKKLIINLLKEKVLEQNLQPPFKEARKIAYKYHKSKSFREGFAEWMSLKKLFNIYEKKIQNRAIEEMISILSGEGCPERKSYERGYKFYDQVMKATCGEIFKVARSPPIYELEVRIPLLYLLRRFPAKTIKSMPRLVAEGIKKNYLKAYYRYKHGYNLVYI